MNGTTPPGPPSGAPGAGHTDPALASHQATAPGGSGAPRQKSPWGQRLGILLAIGVLLLGVVYFTGGLRQLPGAEPEEASVAPERLPDGSSPAAPTDSLLSPEDLPGFETEGLTNKQRLWLYHRAHLEKCACECGMTVAQCRVEDPTCPESPGRAVEMVEEAKKAVPSG